MSSDQIPQLPPNYSAPELAPTLETVPAPPRPRWVRYGANTLLGLCLLLASLPMAWLVGIGAAGIFAGPSKRMPFQEVLLRRTNRVITEVYRLPSRWRPAPPPETRIEPIPIPTERVEPLTTPPAALNQRDRKLAEEELAALNQEFDTIQKRLFDLESKLGQAQSTAAVENRLANLEQRLTPPKEISPAATLPDLPSAPSVPTSSPAPVSPRSPLLETTELKITLPSDALFAPGEARLLTTAPALLNSIFEDLAQYPQSTVLIGSYTDNHLEPSQSVSLAFQQANALRAYLAGHVPNQRWVTVGYGQHQSLSDNSTPQLRQRNRRIEIAIDRR
ncbi:OmpA family protein [Leptothoe kymatousa]|uniref:OmpA family protein n=1 Tax=Leptothoe kymatousa TAU-MAC 1615 TaxID=2364775 RepID=A0ABS5Y675_9CYAN|nr:OmpA family protein [Leptothoe kymatousa]MBT9312854.1 OmpA family protein [Leptothoe kymatousa TAU-MAC 1615]